MHARLVVLLALILVTAQDAADVRSLALSLKPNTTTDAVPDIDKDITASHDLTQYFTASPSTQKVICTGLVMDDNHYVKKYDNTVVIYDAAKAPTTPLPSLGTGHQREESSDYYRRTHDDGVQYVVSLEGRNFVIDCNESIRCNINNNATIDTNVTWEGYNYGNRLDPSVMWSHSWQGKSYLKFTLINGDQEEHKNVEIKESFLYLMGHICHATSVSGIEVAVETVQSDIMRRMSEVYRNRSNALLSVLIALTIVFISTIAAIAFPETPSPRRSRETSPSANSSETSSSASSSETSPSANSSETSSSTSSSERSHIGDSLNETIEGGQSGGESNPKLIELLSTFPEQTYSAFDVFYKELRRLVHKQTDAVALLQSARALTFVLLSLDHASLVGINNKLLSAFK